MPASPPPDSLQGQLNRLAALGAGRLKRWVLRCACDRYLRILFPAALCVSGAILLAVLLDAAAGTTLWPFGLLLTVLVAVALPVLMVAACVLLEFARHRTDRRMCLALYDRELGLKDRLQAADQYLAKAQRTDFEEAAVEDARGACRHRPGAQAPAARNPAAGPHSAAPQAGRTGRRAAGCRPVDRSVLGLPGVGERDHGG